MKPKDIVEEVIDAYGGVSAVQDRMKYKDSMCVYNWRIRGLPKAKLADIHIHTGIAIDRLMKATDLRKQGKSTTQKKLKPKAA